MGCNNVKMLWQRFLDVNLYRKRSSSAETLSLELLATRIYIFTLVIILLCVSVVCSLLVRTSNITEYLPSSATFLYLQKQYPNTLQCPCSKIGITYGTFVNTHIDFHQVYSSDFITQSWIDLVFADRNISNSVTDDIQAMLSFFWQSIAGFCNICNKTWITTSAKFNRSTIFSLNAFSIEYLQAQSETKLAADIALAQTTLTHNLLAFQYSTAANGFVSALSTNFYLPYIPEHQRYNKKLKMLPRTFKNCSCLSAGGCQRPVFVEINESDIFFPVPGLVIDCLIVDAVIVSTLECYYSHECIYLLHKEKNRGVTPLNATLNEQFSIQSTVKQMLDLMMIDRLKIEIVFESFYNQCRPAYCNYSYSKRFDILFVITTILGIFGGLSFILRNIVPLVAGTILNRRNRGQRSTLAQTDLVPFQRNFRK